MHIIKKIGAFIASRALYLALGVFLAASFTAYATWDQARTTANPGELTEANWNEIVTMIENGITNASNLTSGTVPNARLNVDLQDLADGSLTGGKVGAGISGDNITDGSIDASELDANSCGDSEMIDDPTFTSITLGGVNKSAWPAGGGCKIGIQCCVNDDWGSDCGDIKYTNSGWSDFSAANLSGVITGAKCRLYIDCT